MHIYTANEVAELTALAAEARTLDAEWRAVADELGAIVDSLYGFTYTDPATGAQIHTTEMMWDRYAETADLAEACALDFMPAPFHYIPRVGEYCTHNRYNVAEWRKLNNRCRRNIAKARKTIKAYAFSTKCAA